MKRSIRIALVGLLAVGFSLNSGGYGNPDNKPNPELKVPDNIPPGGKDVGSKGGTMKGPPGKK